MAIPGNLGVLMLGRDLGDEYEISMLTLWESIEAIRAFSGDPVDRARYYERDHEFLIDPPERVEHFDVLAERTNAPDLVRWRDSRVPRSNTEAVE